MYFLFNLLIIIIKLTFNFFIFLLLLKVLLRYFSIDYQNPLNLFITRVFNYLKIFDNKALKTVFDSNIGLIGSCLVINFFKFTITSLIMFGNIPNFLSLVFFTFTDMALLVIRLYTFLIIIYVILTWIHPISTSPVIYMLDKMTQPILKKIKKVVPPIFGLDFSPLAALTIMWILENLIIGICINTI